MSFSANKSALLLLVGLSACAGEMPGRECAPPRAADGRIARDPEQRAAFMLEHPCPANGATGGECPGWRVDHIVPLKRCGADTPANMQWLTVEAWKDKTRWE